MSTDSSREALIAFNRFGLGARPGDLETAAGDPRGLLKAELKPDAALIPLEPEGAPGEPLLSGTAANIQAAYAAQTARKLAREQRVRDEQQMAAAAPATASAPMQAPAPAVAPDGAKAEPPPEARIYRAEALARFRMATGAGTGLVERLVAFWSNHFCVSVAKGNILRATAGSFEREAIRPHVLGRFADMLLAVERHPAMLFYLDNAQSVGPESRAGQNRRRGLNENLGREILELHTLGADAGYTQADVTAMARVITGWTFAGREGRLGEPGTFVFNANMHEPGDEMVAGHAYLDGGYGQGEAALNDIARAPATARHIATKLVRHFVADDPPPAAIERIATVFRNRDGDLRAVTMALIDLPESWSAPPTKMRNPYDFLIAAMRLTGTPLLDPGPILNGLRTLGMPLWEPPGPNGFPDTAGAWASPEAMKLRLDLAAGIAQRTKVAGDPLALLDAAAGEAASPETREAVARAESRQQALALLLMSPEFQRR